ncbi:MAG: glutamate--cysteine ligase [Gammaproteobacteria bacterium]|nr:glutamate--cysteine ligase [Gammaproteobacteria bacterium]|tara:strand:- start:1062 stop:2564 length:1503 start_codon:yes stop_codon:yes gene_type:complete
MNNDLERRLQDLKDKKFFDELIISRGIEKEFFRVNKTAQISKKPHPLSLGSALTNRYITTDFAEAQLELVTPVFDEIDDLFDFLTKLHGFVAQNIDEDEMLWPFSMPPHIENESDINLGYYHQSNVGLLKHVYRRGLKVRYGSTMQCISGMHYNFSVDSSSLSKITQRSSQESFNEAYLGLIRNFKRLFWFVLSEFGQTNVVDKSFITNREHQLDELNKNDMYLEHATSLRMSDIGYVSDAQKSLNVKYDSLEEFLEKINKAIKVPFKDFQEKGLLDTDGNCQQISDGIIQIENEYYDSIRPKRASKENLRPYNQLKEYGIEYLEVRGVDIDPNELVGISKHHVQFLDLILLYCLISPSPKISDEEKINIDKNDNESVYRGRSKDAMLNLGELKVRLHDQREKIFNDLKLLAKSMKNSQEMIDSINYVDNYKKGSIPSISYQKYGIIKAREITAQLKNIENNNFDSIKKEAELSLQKLKNMPKNSDDEMNDYVMNYNNDL